MPSSPTKAFKNALKKITPNPSISEWQKRADVATLLKQQKTAICPVMMPAVSVIQEKYAEKYKSTMNAWETRMNQHYHVKDIFSNRIINDLYAQHEVPNFHAIALKYAQDHIPKNALGISPKNAEFAVSISGVCKSK